MLEFLQLYAAFMFIEFMVLQAFTSRSEPIESTRYGLAHLVGCLLSVNIRLSWSTALIVAALSLTHALARFARIKLSALGGFWEGSWKIFLLDQAIRVALIYTASLLITKSGLSHLAKAVAAILGSSQTYLYAVIFIGVVFGGGILVQRVSDWFFAKISTDLQKIKPGLPLAGRYIGWTERTLILLFFVAEIYDAIGLLLALKALARYPEISKDEKGHFSEYFLIGTLTSFGIALIGGFAFNKLS